LFKDRISLLQTALSGFHSEIVEVGGENDRAFCRFRVTGRHTGELAGFLPTGNLIRFDGCVIAHAAGGRLTEEWEFVDTMALMAQLGGKTLAVGS
jgi:predicted ester cyclase